jgi:hypothetical protein
MDFSW